MAARPLLVLGTSLFAQEIAELAGDCPDLDVVGFVENFDRARCEQELDGLPVHWIDDAAALAPTHDAVCGLGTTRRSGFTDQAEGLGFRFATVVHPTAHVAHTAELGPGTIVGVGAIVASHARLGAHVLLNRASSVGHHTMLGDHASVQTGAHVAGSCVVGPQTYIGMGAVVVDHRSVGAGCVVGAGAVVTIDLPDRVRALGVPARIVAEEVEPL